MGSIAIHIHPDNYYSGQNDVSKKENEQCALRTIADIYPKSYPCIHILAVLIDAQTLQSLLRQQNSVLKYLSRLFHKAVTHLKRIPRPKLSFTYSV